MSNRDPFKLRSWHVDAFCAALVVAITIVAVLAVVQPILRSGQERLTTQTQLESLQDQSEQIESALAAARVSLLEVQTDLPDHYLQLQPLGHLNTSLANLTAVATSCGLVLHETSSGTATAGTWYDSVPIEVTGTGSYPACAVFLHRLRDELPDIEVRSFELTDNPANASSATSVRFDLSWYAASNHVLAPADR